MDAYRRSLQKSYIAACQAILLSTSPKRFENEAYSILKADLTKLQTEEDQALPVTKDRVSQYHLIDMQNRIKKYS